MLFCQSVVARWLMRVAAASSRVFPWRDGRPLPCCSEVLHCGWHALLLWPLLCCIHCCYGGCCCMTTLDAMTMTNFRPLRYTWYCRARLFVRSFLAWPLVFVPPVYTSVCRFLLIGLHRIPKPTSLSVVVVILDLSPDIALATYRRRSL